MKISRPLDNLISFCEFVQVHLRRNTTAILIMTISSSSSLTHQEKLMYGIKNHTKFGIEPNQFQTFFHFQVLKIHRWK